MFSSIQWKWFEDGIGKYSNQSARFSKIAPDIRRMLKERDIQEEAFPMTLESLEELGEKVKKMELEIRSFYEKNTDLTPVEREGLDGYFKLNSEELRTIWRRLLLVYIQSFKAKSRKISEEILMKITEQSTKLFWDSKNYNDVLKRMRELIAEYHRIIKIAELDNISLSIPRKYDDLEREMKGLREISIEAASHSIAQIREEFYKHSEHQNYVWSKWLLLFTTAFTAATFGLSIAEYLYGNDVRLHTDKPIQVEATRARSSLSSSSSN